MGRLDVALEAMLAACPSVISKIVNYQSLLSQHWAEQQSAEKPQEILTNFQPSAKY